MIGLRSCAMCALGCSALVLGGLQPLGCLDILAIDDKYLVDGGGGRGAGGAGGGGAGGGGAGGGGAEAGPPCGSPYDPHNCGTCGHDCEHGACFDGVCQPYELAFTPPGDRPNTLVVPGDGYVYFFDYDALTLHRVQDGVAAQSSLDHQLVALPNAGGPSALVVDGPYVYFSLVSSWPTSVYGTDTSGSKPVALAGGESWLYPEYMAEDPSNLYVTTSPNADCEIFRVPRSGGPAALILVVPGGACGTVAEYGGQLYIPDAAHGSVLRLPADAPPLDLDGGAPDGGAGAAEVIDVEPQSQPTIVTTDSTYVYWADHGAIHRKRLDAGVTDPADTLAMFPDDGKKDDFPWSLSVQGDRIFYAVPGFDNGTGVVASVPSAPAQGTAATPVVIASSLHGATAVVATSSAVYWMVQFDYHIMKVVR